GETRPGQGAQPRPGERPSASDTSRPGEHHEILEPVIGEWTALVTVHRGGREIESRGTMRNEWVLGKRFIRGEYTGDEETGGERREGVSYLGYNNATDEYEAM